MALDFPTLQEVIERCKTDVQQELQNSNPFLPNSFLSAITVSNAGRNYESNLQIQRLNFEMFPDTATGTYLERWGSYFSITRNPATQSNGFIVATGSLTSDIPILSVLTSSDGLEYETLATQTISANIVSVTSMTRSGQVVTVITTANHSFASGMEVTIAGANETEYNGTFVINVTSNLSFIFNITTTPSTPATGTITASANMAVLEVESTNFGADTNQDSGSILTLASPISGVDSTTYVQFDGLSGGSDLESDDDLRSRILDRIQDPITPFNSANIEVEARKISGVTRVWVEEITPDVGQVTIYFVRDNDTNIIPDAGEVAAVKTQILTIKPAHTADDDVIVNAPTPVTVDFSFVSILPDTSSMRTAVQNSLQQFFSERTEVGEDILEIAYNSAIYNTIDPETGNKVQSFVLSSPTGDVSISTGELGILGNISF